MNDVERTLEHYRKLLEDTVRRLGVFEWRPTVDDLTQYTVFKCVKCFRDCKPSNNNLCNNCWDKGSKVQVVGCPQEGIGIVEKLYTFHWGAYGTMTGVRFPGGYFEYFNERLELVNE